MGYTDQNSRSEYLWFISKNAALIAMILWGIFFTHSHVPQAGEGPKYKFFGLQLGIFIALFVIFFSISVIFITIKFIIKKIIQYIKNWFYKSGTD
jgi:hypothetical protein